MIGFSDVEKIYTSKIAECALGKTPEMKSEFKSISEYDKPISYFADNPRNYCPLENGEWSGERGDSKWNPDRNYVPQKSNPEGKTWGEILDEHGIDGINFNDGEPDFSEISKGTVEVSPFSDNREKNFSRADIELAKQWGCTPEEVYQYRKENKLTWHECSDMKTMQLVPSVVHNNVPHSGGISEVKKGAAA